MNGMGMLATRVIKCPIVNPTATKLGLLEGEWDNVQHYLQTGEGKEKCHSWYPHDMRYNRGKKPFKEGREYPLYLRSQGRWVDYEKLFIRIPVKGRWGGVWMPIHPHIPLSPDYRIHDSQIVKTRCGFQVNLVVSKEVEIDYSFSSLIAVDLGERVTATAVPLENGVPVFYGCEIRGIRRHHAWLRKRLGEKKLLKEIRKQGSRERRRVDAVLHKISKDIVVVASTTNSAIVLGNVHGIRQRANAKKRGKRFNRIINSWAYDKLCQMIEYKANWQGIPVIYVNEDYTSQTCSRCHNLGKRPRQGLFVCPACGYRVNADFNGAKNILERTSEYISEVGAIGSLPLTTPSSVSVEVGGCLA